MNIKKERQRIVGELLNGTDGEFTDEELMRELMDTSVTENADGREKRPSASAHRTRWRGSPAAGRSSSASSPSWWCGWC